MKTLLFIVSLTLLMIECENSDTSSLRINNEDIIGEWVNSVLDSDTLFISDSIIIRIDITTMLPKHSYSYCIIGDSILLEYTGEYYIYALPSLFKITLDNNKSILIIDGFSTYFPKYPGDEFKKLSSEN